MRSSKRLAALTLALGLSATVFPPGMTSHQAVAAPVGTLARASLDRKVPEARFENVGLGDAIEYVRDISGANLTVNWRALAELNVTKETPINVRLYNVSLRKVLNTVLAEAGAGSGLSYLVDDGVIEVTTQQLADARIYTKVYPIDDLLMEIPNFDNAPDFNLQSQNSGGGGGGKSGGGGGSGNNSLFGSGSGGNKKDEKIRTKDERAREIVDLIVNTVRPEAWRENGGTASIRYFNGSLVVSAPMSMHEMIGN